MADRQGGKPKGVTRRRFLGTTTAGAAATLLHAHGALASPGTADAAPAPTGGAAKTAAGKSGAAVFHGSPAVTELSSGLHKAHQNGFADPASPFGRMFPSLPAYSPTDQALVNLASTIPSRPVENPDNPQIPAGFTYIGQFIDHDVTFDEVSSLLGTNDPNNLSSTRTARFDLDSMYGFGPDASPQFYNPSDPKKLLIVQPSRFDDVPRESSGKAIIADPRNDQHKIIVQLHVAYMRFHNAVVDMLRGQGTAEEELFATAQQTVRFHHQWIAVKQFLPRVAGQDVVNSILTADANGLPQVATQFYQPTLGNPFMPVEFSVAAYRFAHSMVRDTYRINESRSVPLLGRLLGGSAVTQGSSIMFGGFFDIPGSTVLPQASKRIDGKMVIPLGNLPGSITGDALVASLAERNLRRGKSFGLPSGQQVAAFMGADVLTNEQLGLTDPGLGGEAPLWFYILKEAEIQQLGRSLGQVGARIVAEVLLGMMAADPNSYFNAAPTFQPAPPIAPAVGAFGIADLMIFGGARI